MVLGLKKQTAQSRKQRPGRRRQHVVSAVKVGAQTEGRRDEALWGSQGRLQCGGI